MAVYTAREHLAPGVADMFRPVPAVRHACIHLLQNTYSEEAVEAFVGSRPAELQSVKDFKLQSVHMAGVVLCSTCRRIQRHGPCVG